jgi:Ni/Co efflux regulator RcnB
MNRITRTFALPLLAAALTCVPAVAQDHPDQDHHDNSAYRQHQEWRQGSRIQQEDWNRGEKVDYHANHLRRPPEGHEWRLIDGNYVLADRDGTIRSVRPAHHDHDNQPHN